MAICKSKAQCCCGCDLATGSAIMAVLMLLGGCTELYKYYGEWGLLAITSTEAFIYIAVDLLVILTGVVGLYGMCVAHDEQKIGAIQLFRNLYLAQIVVRVVGYLAVLGLLFFAAGADMNNGSLSSVLVAGTLINLVLYLLIASAFFSVVDSFNDVVKAGGDGTEKLKADDVRKQHLDEESTESGSESE